MRADAGPADERRAAGVAPGRVLAVSASAESSGAEAVLLRSLAHLASTGWSVTLATPPGEVADRAAADGHHVVDLPAPKLEHGRSAGSLARLAARWLLGARTLRALAAEHDVVLVNSLHALAPTRLARPGAPVVWLVHDVVRRRDLRAVVRASAAAVDLAIAVSRTSGELPTERGIPTTVVRNGFEAPGRLATPDRSVAPIVGMAARLTPWKGHEVALAAVAAMRHDVVLELVGGAFATDAHHADALVRLADELGIADRVTFTGQVDDALDRMARWSIAVSASVEPEAGPLNVGEALSLGIPVVATAHGGAAELRTPAVELVAPGDHRALADRLDLVVDELGARTDAARELGPRLVAARLDHHRQAEAFTRALSSVLPGAGSAGGSAGRDRPLSLLLVNEGIGGHDTVHRHLSIALEERSDVRAVHLRIPAPSLARRAVGAPIPGLARLDLDLQPLRAQLAASWALRRRLRPWIHRVDVVHLYTQTAGQLVTDLLARVPTVVSTDTTAVENARRLPYRAPTRFTPIGAELGRRLEARTLAAADVVAAGTRWVADSLRSSHGDGVGELRVQPLGLTDPQPDEPAPVSGRPIVTFVGRQWRRKGAGRLLELWAAGLHERADLVIVSPEPVPPTPGVRVLDDVVVGDGRLDALLAETAVFAFPSTIDQAPNAVLEAMAAGLACVVAAQGGQAEMVVDGETGLLVPPDDTPALGRAIGRLLDDDALRLAMGCAARRRFLERYSATATTEALVGLCRLAVERHHAEPRDGRSGRGVVDVAGGDDPAGSRPGRSARRGDRGERSSRSRAAAARARGPASALATLAAGRPRSSGGVVLGYHDVVAGPATERWDVSLDDLRAHVDVLRRRGFRFARLDELLVELRAGRDVDGLAVVTFDDALVGVLDAAELLDRLDVPATVLAVADDPGSVPRWWPGARRTLRADELRDLAAAGHEIGAHSRTHRSLVGLGDDDLADEIAGSIDRVADAVGRPVRTVAYPHGHHDQRARRAVEAAGALGAVTFANGRVRPTTDPFAVPRLTAGAHFGARRLDYHLLRSAASWPVDDGATGDRATAAPSAS